MQVSPCQKVNTILVTFSNHVNEQALGLCIPQAVVGGPNNSNGAIWFNSYMQDIGLGHT